jgi:hypothetical protein
MKIDPISTHERAIIIAQLANVGKWQSRRMGALVRMVRFQSANGCQLRYSVTVRTRVITDTAPTVYAAVEACNQIIRGRHLDPPAGRAVKDPSRTGTPQLIRHRTELPAENPLPFDQEADHGAN